VSKRARRWSWQSVVCRVGTGPLEVLTNHRFKFLEGARLDIELPLKVGTHLSFHLVNLPKGKHTLTNNTPGLVGVSIIADDLGSNHKCRDEKAVTGGTASGDESRLESLQQIECSKGHGGRKPRAMKCIGDEVGERRGGSGCGRWRRLVGAVEEVVHIASTHLRGLFMTIVWVRMPGTCAGRRWLGGGSRGGDGSVDDLGGCSTDVAGWRGMAGDDSSSHVLEMRQALEK